MPPSPDSPDRILARAGARHVRLAAGGVVASGPVTWSGDPTGLFQIGSVTKVFTGLLLATYVVDGELGLDQPVGELVDDLPDPVAEVTLQQLATHTSGLPRIPRELWWRWLARHPDPYADIDHDVLVRSLASTRLRRRRRPAYSNLGTGLLGHALARRAGTSYDALVRERVSGPLGMAATGTDPTEPPPGHRRRGAPRELTWSLDALAGAGALWSTVADLQRFLVAQLDPPEDRLGAAIRLTRATRVRGKRMDLCLGWFALHGRDGELLWHDGGTAGYRSFVGVDPGRGTGVAVLSASDRSVDRLGVALSRALSDAAPA